MVPLYTSEVFFLLHPFVFIDTGRASIILFLSRVLLNVAAITIWTWTSSMAGLVASLICLAVSAFLWLVTGVVRRNMDTPKWLRMASYLSIINWSIDLPGIKLILAGKPVSKIPTIIIIFLNVVAGALLAFIELAVEPLADAWGCYPPGKKSMLSLLQIQR